MEHLYANAEARIKSSTRIVLAAQARAAAGSTAFAAALLLYFGFNSVEPSRNDLGDWSLWILFCTLRFGGLACAALTVVLFLGVGAALIADAIVSTVIGVLLILTGAGLAIGGGTMMQAAINVVCGFMFASYGVRTGLIFAANRKVTFKVGDIFETGPDESRKMPFDNAPIQSETSPESASNQNLMDSLRTNKLARQATEPVKLPTSELRPADAPSEEGFLAALAKNRSKNNDSSGAV
ncbi:MAG: hypothetical protein HY287_11795 [Planctomycetes bacterium]|nr:hypothetical protein [Planctomycetota bacterium]